jgi:hypothetical protein
LRHLIPIHHGPPNAAITKGHSMSTKKTKPANELKPKSGRKPQVWLCNCVGTGHAEAHAWTNLTKGFVTIVSVEDADLLASRVWHAHVGKGGTPYAKSRVQGGKGKQELLHRLITGAVGSTQVDHKNGVGLDNCRSNLRPATHAQNMANRRPRKRRSAHIPSGISLPRGVSYTPNRKNERKPFRAKVTGKHIGYFSSTKEAAAAYDAKAREMWGEFALLNYPDEPMQAAAE